ncbi:MAG: hypothetical protein LUQ57_03895 [Methylococcaceae bacterium]|nr:hypothetical protein [Methylococcaceae bacterium]
MAGGKVGKKSTTNGTAPGFATLPLEGRQMRLPRPIIARWKTSTCNMAGDVRRIHLGIATGCSPRYLGGYLVN